MRSKTVIFFLLFSLMFSSSSRSQSLNTTDLYKQTSEMNNTMVHYDADLGSISRFYTNNSDPYAWMQENAFHSPECIARLLQLNNDYLQQLQGVDFDKMSTNGKVDFLLFKRNLTDANYKLQQEQKKYDAVKQFFPFAAKIYELEKPRRRGAVVNGEQFAHDLNDIFKQLKKIISYEK